MHFIFHIFLFINFILMSPPEIWGPACWMLFHSLIERLNDRFYDTHHMQLFNMITQICRNLPCPHCTHDASSFLSKINVKTQLNTKTNFINTFYLFHNWVNAKKRKPLFNYINMTMYKNINLTFVINNFIKHYTSRTNSKLMAENMQRSFIVKNFLNWLKINNYIFTANEPAPSVDDPEIKATEREIPQTHIEAPEKRDISVQTNTIELVNEPMESEPPPEDDVSVSDNEDTTSTSKDLFIAFEEINPILKKDEPLGSSKTTKNRKKKKKT
jgi:hypothetical protein